MRLSINARALQIASTEQLHRALDEVDPSQPFELWMSIPDGPSICMLRNGANAWLMYLREPSDSGFISIGNPDRTGSTTYTLSNGQVDEYPLAWCIDITQCHRALADFLADGGARPDAIHWQDA